MSGFTSALSLLIVLLQGPTLLAGQTPLAPQAPATAPSTTVIEGTWSVTPLAMKGAPAPGGAEQLLGFGDVYRTESFVAFWAQTGPEPSRNTLFSWKDGRLTRVLQWGAEFVAPDSRPVSVRLPFSDFRAGKRLLYFSPTAPAHVYAWDGEKLVKVLSAGDELQFRNERYTIKRARVLDTAPDGKALIAFDAPSQHASGWAVHDGFNFKPLMLKGGELPGMPGVRIDKPWCLGECEPRPEETARLLEDGSVLISLTVREESRKNSRLALFRVFPERTEVMVEQGSAAIGCDAQRLIFPSQVPIRVTTRCGELTFAFNWRRAGKPMEIAQVISDERTSSVQEKRMSDGASEMSLGEGDKSILVFSYLVLGKVLAATPQAFAMGYWSDFFRKGGILVSYAGKFRLGVYPGSIESWVFLASDSPRGLAAGRDVSHPLCFWNGEKLSPVAWEESVGIGDATARELLQGREGYIPNIGIRAIPGPIGGVSVQLPALADKPRTWYVPANSTDGKLQQPPRFPVAGHAITLADVVSWKEDEVLALTEEGLFRLRRAH